MIKGMAPVLARQYVKVIEQIERLVDRIHALGYMMSLFEQIEEGAMEIKPVFIGTMGKAIAEDVLRITEILDNDFVSVAEVKLMLETREDKE
jgi:acetolactate synthase small subunit